MKRVATPLLLSLAALTAAGASALAQSPSPGHGPTPLMEAAWFAPMGSGAILFTDWAASKAAHGYADMTNQTPLDERLHALFELGTMEAPFAGYAVGKLATHAEAWGWDTSDLDWEASYLVDGPPVAVLRFRDGFDLAPIVAHFDERGFTSEVYGDATIRSHAMEPSAAWITDSEFGILNTAILDDGRTLVLSSAIEGVKATLDARNVDYVRAPPAWVVAGTLGAPLSAAIDVGTDACAAYDPHAVPGGSGANDALLAEVGTLHPWEAMGVGTYRDAAGVPTGRYVFEYGAPADPIADEGGRARLADLGISIRVERPYAQVVFRLVTFGVEGNAVTLDVAPVDGQPRRLQQAFFGRDMVFATCG